MNAPATSLAILQRDFQRHVMHGDDVIVSAVTGTPRVPSTVRLGIYSEAYKLRLTDALASTLPRLQQLMGKDQFAGLASDYIDIRPSQFPSIRWFGGELPALLERLFPEQPWLGELAAWEWAIAAAFDAADADPIGIEALAAVAPDSWPALQFEFHPSVQLVPMRTNAPVLFKTLAEDGVPPECMALDAAQPWLIWREALKTQYRSLAADEAAALESMRAGGTFETLCDTLCAWHEPEAVPMQAAGMLKRWVVEQMIVRVFTAE
jgi:hypothetical protein